MKQLIAIHEVIRDGKDGKSEAIAPNTGFSASDELASLLLDLGAARLDDSTVAVQESDETDLMKLKKDDLIALAAERQVEIGENATKADIVAALNAADAEDDAEEELV